MTKVSVLLSSGNDVQLSSCANWKDIEICTDYKSPTTMCQHIPFLLNDNSNDGNHDDNDDNDNNVYYYHYYEDQDDNHVYIILEFMCTFDISNVNFITKNIYNTRASVPKHGIRDVWPR